MKYCARSIMAIGISLTAGCLVARSQSLASFNPFAGIKTVTLNSTTKSTLSPFEIAEYARGGHTLDPEWIVSTSYSFQDGNYLCKAQRDPKASTPGLEFEFGFDGKTYLYFDRKDRVARISQKDHSIAAPLWGANTFALLFDFLQAQNLTPAATTGNMNQGEANFDFSNIAALWKSANFKLNTQKTTGAIQTYEASYGNGFSVSVQLDTSLQGLPTSFEIDKNGKIFRKLVVNSSAVLVDSKTGVSIPYAKTFTYTYYEDGNLIKTDATTINSATVNQALDPDTFVLDPSRALMIFDVDNDKMIHVPQ